MAIPYRCPHCGAAGVADDQYAGQTGPCASCGQTLAIPIASSASGPLPPGGSSGSGIGSIVMIVAAVGVAGLCGIGILIALLVPAVSSSRDAARRMQCSNNMKQIALAMLNYESTNGSFPPAYTVDENGQPLHSWRVLILPYLEQRHLYEQIARDEPWDSPANRQFHDVMIDIYGCPASVDEPSDTNYMVLVGDETLFPPEGKSLAPSDVRDGLSNTILVVEIANTGVHWMEPTDLQFDIMAFTPNSGRDGLASEHRGMANVALADGSVHAIDDDVDPQTLRAMSTASGGEHVPGNW
ncbi:MAG: DUF1559 domain-containing protein [Pirellulales bacterium]